MCFEVNYGSIVEPEKSTFCHTIHIFCLSYACLRIAQNDAYLDRQPKKNSFRIIKDDKTTTRGKWGFWVVYGALNQSFVPPLTQVPVSWRVLPYKLSNQLLTSSPSFLLIQFNMTRTCSGELEDIKKLELISRS